MTRTRRLAASLSATALLALSVTGCGLIGGGASGAPDDASESDFCSAFAGLLKIDPEASAADRVEDLHAVADDLEETGTPEGITDEERKGFEVFVDAIKDVDEDNVDDLQDSESPEDFGISGDDADAADSFADYAGETCADSLLENLPSDAAS